MATQTLPPEIKLANVGDRRKKEKKRGAFMAWWMTPTGLALKTALAKVVVALLVGCIGVGAHFAGKANRPKPGDYLATKHRNGIFDAREEKKNYGEVQGLPSDVAPRGDSLSMIAGSVDGQTDAQRAAAAAAAQAAANQASAAATAGGDGKAGASGSANVDPAALMGQVAGSIDKAGKDGKDGRAEGKDGKFAKKFGALSQSFGGGSSMLAGGPGLAGGTLGAFKPLNGGPGAGLRAAVGNGGVPRTSAPRSHGSAKSAFGQLTKAAQFSNRATTQTGEQAATTAGAAFNGDMAGGNSILGNGAGVGGAGVGTPTGGGAGSQGSGGGGGGGPTNSPGIGTSGNGTGQASDCNIMSQDVGMSLVPGSSGGCVPDVNHKDVTPWSDDSKQAQLYSMLAAACLAIAGLASMFSKSYPWVKYIVYLFAGLAALFGLMALIEGYKIFSKGGQIEGVMYMLGGLISIIMAIKMMKDQADASDAAAKAQEQANTDAANRQSAEALDHKTQFGQFGPDGSNADVSNQSGGLNALNSNATDPINGAEGTPDAIHDPNGVLGGQVSDNATYSQITNSDGTAQTLFTNPDGTQTLVNTDATGNITGYSTAAVPSTGGPTTYTDFGSNGSMTGQQVVGANGQVQSTTSIAPDGTITRQNDTYVTGGDGKSVETVKTQTVAGASGYADAVKNAPPGSSVSVVRDSTGQPLIQTTPAGGGTPTYVNGDGSARMVTVDSGSVDGNGFPITSQQPAPPPQLMDPNSSLAVDSSGKVTVVPSGTAGSITNPSGTASGYTYNASTNTWGSAPTANQTPGALGDGVVAGNHPGATELPSYSNNGYMSGPGGYGSSPDLPGRPGEMFTAQDGTVYQADSNGTWMPTGDNASGHNLFGGNGLDGSGFNNSSFSTGDAPTLGHDGVIGTPSGTGVTTPSGNIAANNYTPPAPISTNSDVVGISSDHAAPIDLSGGANNPPQYSPVAGDGTLDSTGQWVFQDGQWVPAGRG